MDGGAEGGSESGAGWDEAKGSERGEAACTRAAAESGKMTEEIVGMMGMVGMVLMAVISCDVAGMGDGTADIVRRGRGEVEMTVVVDIAVEEGRNVETATETG